MDFKKESLLHALKIGALELLPDGRELKSKRISPYFFNSGLYSTGLNMSILANAYALTIYDSFSFKPDVIFGPAYKGIPLSVATAMRYTANTGVDISYTFDRKEDKDHGEGGKIVGSSLTGKNVVIVDDVMTTGTSVKEAMSIIQSDDGKVVGVIISFDRQERGRDTDLSAVQGFEKEYSIPVYSAVNLTDMISCFEEDSSLCPAPILEQIYRYRDKYGVTV